MKFLFLLPLHVFILFVAGCDRGNPAESFYSHPSESLEFSIRFDEVDSNTFHRTAQWSVFENETKIFSGKMFIAREASDASIPFQFTASNGTSGAGYIREDTIQFIPANIKKWSHVDMFERLSLCRISSRGSEASDEFKGK